MTPTLSFMSANFVARELDYHMTGDWQEGEAATQDAFRPAGTFAGRFARMLDEIRALGFEAIDLWCAHLHHAWATPDQIAIARRLLEERGLRVVSYAGWVSGEKEDFEAALRLCQALEIPLLGGYLERLERDREGVTARLRETGISYGYENHPEDSAEAILARLGEGDEDVIGVTFDTGWLQTQGGDPLAALERLAPCLRHLHLKDIRPRRRERTGFPFIDRGHETCRLGTGTVPVEAIVKRLPRLGYRGAIAIEHEPERFDPREDCAGSREAVLRWLRHAPA